MKRKTLAPIALFVYTRLDHTKKTVEKLKKNILAKDSRIFIFSDGPKTLKQEADVLLMRKYLRTIKGFKSIKIFESKKNKGLAQSIISGVTKLVNKHGKIIVVEDDLLTSKYFLKFMNDALDYYSDDERVMSVSGYVYPIKGLPETFFLRNAECWGWATWKRGWALFEKDSQKLLNEIHELGLVKDFTFNNSFDYEKMLRWQIAGKISSWAIRWYASALLNNKFCLYPGKSLVRNTGVDGSGTHGGKADVYATDLYENPITIGGVPVVENIIVRKKFENYFSKITSRFYKTFLLAKNIFSSLLLQ